MVKVVRHPVYQPTQEYVAFRDINDVWGESDNAPLVDDAAFYARSGFGHEAVAKENSDIFDTLGAMVKDGVARGVVEGTAFINTTKARAEEALELAGDFAKACVNLLHTTFIQEYQPTLEEISNKINEAKRLNSFLVWFKAHVGSLISLFIGFILFYLSYREGMFTADRKGFLSAAPYIMMLLSTGSSLLDMSPIVEMLQSVSLHSETPAMTDSNIFSYLLGMFSSGLLRMLDATWANMTLSQIAKVCTTFVAFARVWEITDMKRIFHYLPACFSTLYFHHSGVGGYKAFVRAYNYFYIEYSIYRRDPVANKRDKLIDAYRLFTEAVDLETKKLTSDETVKVTEMIKQVTNIMAPIYTMIGKVSRKKPYWIYIAGQMGTGKTFLSRALTEELRELFGWRPDQVYDRSNTPFWDGYNTDMKIVRIDDFLADSMDPNILSVFTMISTNPWRLNMATVDNPDLGVKGTPFMSYILITTSNFMNCSHIKGLYNEDAWKSRRRMLVEVRLTNAEGQAAFSPIDSGLLSDIDSRLDMNKVIKRYGNDLTDKPYLRFVVYNSKSTSYCRQSRSVSWNCFYRNLVEDLSKWMNEKSYGIEATTTRKIIGNGYAKHVVSSPSQNKPTTLEIVKDKIVSSPIENAKIPVVVSTIEEEDTEENLPSPRDEPIHTQCEEMIIKVKAIQKKRANGEVETHAGRPKSKKVSVSVCSQGNCQCHAKLTMTPCQIAAEGKDSVDEDSPLLGLFEKRQKTALSFSEFEAYPTDLIEMEHKGDGEELSTTERVCYFVTGLAGIAGMLGLAYKAKCLFEELAKEEECVVPVLQRGGAGRVYSGGNEGRKQGVMTRSLHAGSSSLTDVHNAVSKNLVEIYHDDKTRQGTALFIRLRTCVMPFHFVAKHSVGDALIMKSPLAAEPQTVTIESLRRLYWDESNKLPRDLCLVTFARTSTFADITAYFPKKEDAGRRKRSGLVIAGLGGAMKTPHVPFLFLEAKFDVTSEGDDIITVSTGDDSIDVCYKNNLCVPTKMLHEGDCGSVLIDPDTSSRARYYGMYTSAHGEYKRYFEPLFCDDLVQKVYPLPDHGHLSFEEPTTFPTAVHMGGLPIQGKLIEKIPRSTVNKIERSVIYEEHSISKPNLKWPAILSKNDDRNIARKEPLANASKYNSTNKPLSREDQRLLAKAVTILSHKVNSLEPIVEVQSVRSEREVLSGVEGVEGFDSMPTSGSPGFLHTNIRPPGASGRGHLFKDTEPHDGEPFIREINESNKQGKFLRERIQALEKCLECGTLPNDLWWVDCCKMEKLKKKKIDEVGTRIFSMGPLEYFILCKRYFMDFAKFVSDHFLDLPFSIGIDVKSKDWHDMWKQAEGVAKKGFDGDYHGFDGGIHGELVSAALDVICRWYSVHSKDVKTERDNVTRKILMEIYAYGIHVAGDVVYGTNGGTPSGHYLTAIVNSLVNVLYIIMAILKKHPDHAGALWLLYWINTYGDDNLIVTSCDFTGGDLQSFLASIGVVYTPADKESTEFVTRPLCELEFLKHTSRKVGGYYFPIAVRSSLNGMLNWVVPQKNPEEDALNYVTTWDDALTSMFFFEKREDFDELYFLCLRTAKECGFSRYPSNYAEICRRIEDSWPTVPIARLFANRNAKLHSGGENLAEGSSVAEPIPGVQVEATERPHKRPEPPISIAAKPIQYSNISEKWFTVSDDEWAVTDNSGDLLMSFSVPNDLMKNYQLRQGLTNMEYFNFNYLEVKVLINGTKFHQGALIVVFSPTSKNIAESVYPGNSLVSAINLQHGLVYPMNNEPVSMIIPYAHPETAIKTSPTSDGSFQGAIGTLLILVFSPLQAASNASNTISYTLMLRIKEPKYYLARPISAPVTRSNKVARRAPPPKLHRGGADLTCLDHTKPELVIKPVEYEVYVPKLHGNSSSKKGDTIINNFTKIIGGGGQTIANNTDGDEYDQSANTEAKASMDYGYMDKFMQALNPIPFFRRPVPHFNAKNGIVYGDMMALHPDTLAVTKKSDFAREDDEMDIDYLVSKQAYGTIFTWSEQDAPGDILLAKLITPCLYTTNFRTEGNVTLPSVPTLDYIANLFYLYVMRQITLRVIILGSPFASGRLLMTPMFGWYKAAPPKDTLDTQLQKVISMEENQRVYEVTWDIPANIPAKFVTATHENNLNEENRELTSIGSFYIAVQTPYRVGEGIPTSCEIFVSYAIPKGGIDFFMPNQNEMKIENPTLNSVSRKRGVKLHGGGVATVPVEGIELHSGGAPLGEPLIIPLAYDTRPPQKVPRVEKPNARLSQSKRKRIRLHAGGVEIRGDSEKEIADTDAPLGEMATVQGTGKAVGQFCNLKPTRHLRDMGKAFQLVGVDSVPYPLNNNDVIGLSNLFRAASPQSAIVKLYAFFKGGLNWVLKGNNTIIAFRPGFINDASTTPNIAPNIRGDRLFHTYTPNANEEVVTFSTPFSTPYKFLLAPQVSGTNTDSFVRNPVETYSSVTERSYYQWGDLVIGGGGDNNDRLWMSFDDAFRCGALLGPNFIVITEAWSQV